MKKQGADALQMESVTLHPFQLLYAEGADALHTWSQMLYTLLQFFLILPNRQQCRFRYCLDQRSPRDFCPARSSDLFLDMPMLAPREDPDQRPEYALLNPMRTGLVNIWSTIF